MGMLLAGRCLVCCYGQQHKEIEDGNGVMRGIIKRRFDWLARCLSLWHVVLTASSVVQLYDSWSVISGFDVQDNGNWQWHSFRRRHVPTWIPRPRIMLSMFVLIRNIQLGWLFITAASNLNVIVCHIPSHTLFLDCIDCSNG
jgi:hypothetical protein